MLEEKPTGEGNKTEIIVPVKDRYDKLKFEVAITRQLSYFNNFKFINLSSRPRKVLFENEDCVILDNPPYNDLHIVLGNVCYEIDYTTAGLNSTYSSPLKNCGIGLKFKIGELQPTISREDIFWNDAVKAKVAEKIKVVKKAIAKEIEKELELEDDYYKFFGKVRTRQTTTFKHQWNFAEVGYSAKFKSKLSVGGNSYKTWFFGHTLKSVSPNSSRRSKADYTITAFRGDYDVNPDQHVFRIKGNLSTVKTLYLFKKIGNFVIVSKDDTSAIAEGLKEKNKSEIEMADAWYDTLPFYDDIPLPEADTELELEEILKAKEAYKALVKQRKVEGKFTAKKIQIFEIPRSNDLESSCAFEKYESKFEEEKDLDIVYGNSEDNDILKSFASILNRNKEKCKIKVLKVSQQYNKQFSQLPNAYNIKDVLKMETPISKKLLTIVTSYKYLEVIGDYDVLKHFKNINKEMYEKYISLRKTIDDNTVDGLWYDNELFIDLKNLCSSLGQSDIEMDSKFKEIDDYFKGIEVLKYVKFQSGMENDLKAFLKSQNKQID